MMRGIALKTRINYELFESQLMFADVIEFSDCIVGVIRVYKNYHK